MPGTRPGMTYVSIPRPGISSICTVAPDLGYDLVTDLNNKPETRKPAWRSISRSRRRPRPSARTCASGCTTSASPPRRSSTAAGLQDVLGELRTKARAQGLWCPFIPKEYGGMGLGPLANALVQMELGESHLGALSMNTQGPDDATMLTLLTHGTDYPEGEVPQAAAERREAHLLLDDREGRRRRRHRHADPRGQGRQRELRAERREVVLVGRPRRRHRAGHGQDRPGRAAPPAVLDLPRRAAEPRLQHQARHPDHGRRGPAQPHHGRRPLRDRDQGPGGAGREPARRRGQGLQHGPAPPRLRPAAPRHAQRRHGPARARHGRRPRHQPHRPSASRCTSARRCSSCSPSARPSSTSRG